MMKVIIIGPAYPLRGGLATFNHRLANEFLAQGHDCKLYSFSLQYPGFLFPGKTQFSTDSAPDNLRIKTCINSVNPFNWLLVGNQLKEEQADLVIVRFWLPFMGPALGTILRRLNRKTTRVICIADNIIPHEKRPGDKVFTKYFLRACDAFITMSEKVQEDLLRFMPYKKVRFLAHPLYDNFGEAMDKPVARKWFGLSEGEKVILFFGFIRAYKGLDLLIDAMAILKKRGGMYAEIKLIIAGEYYEDKTKYEEQISKLGVVGNILQQTDFIPDSEVRNYFGAADVVVQPYRNATQSGVTPLAYHFNTPMIVTNVGALPAMVPHGKVGLVVLPTAEDIAQGIIDFYQKDPNHFVENIKTEKKKYTWGTFVNGIFALKEALNG